MCLALPLRVVRVGESKALVERAGVRFQVDTRLVTELSDGDYVLVHAGFAIQKIERQDVEEIEKLIGQDL
jgi:hydrogenase expression/formation protein HypC